MYCLIFCLSLLTDAVGKGGKCLLLIFLLLQMTLCPPPKITYEKLNPTNAKKIHNFDNILGENKKNVSLRKTNSFCQNTYF